jgi:hypothetical protein
MTNPETPHAVSEDTLVRIAPRALALLSGLSRNPAARMLLAPYGYTDEEHQLGWSLLNATGGAPSAFVKSAPSAASVNGAIAELGAWGVRMFTVADASLAHAHRPQHAFLFQGGLEAKQGADAVVAVGTFLARLDGLERDPARASTRADDRAALGRLANRGLTEEERARAQRLVDAVQEGAALPDASTTAATAADAARLALYAWFDEWSKIARVAITRRDLLIRLGLASPRKAARAAAPKPTPDAKPADAKPAAPTRPSLLPARPSAAPSPN